MQKPTDTQIKATLDQMDREAKAAHASVERRFSEAQRRRMFFAIAQNQVEAKREALRRVPRRVDRLGMEQVDRTMKRTSIVNDLIAQADRKSQ